jgi:predicted hotdog family 3-hydroxylacyl-ACP dehydratase
VSGPAFAPVESLVPHAGPMCLLARVIEHGPERTLCGVDPAQSAVLASPDGSIPIWVGLEYMAQCIAAHAGLLARARGEAPRPGVLLGSRRLRFAAQRFARDRELCVEARHHRGERGLVAFDCEVREASGGPPLVQGRLNVYIVGGFEELEAGRFDGG